MIQNGSPRDVRVLRVTRVETAALRAPPTYNL